jgi:hypothetical protein
MVEPHLDATKHLWDVSALQPADGDVSLDEASDSQRANQVVEQYRRILGQKVLNTQGTRISYPAPTVADETAQSHRIHP